MSDGRGGRALAADGGGWGTLLAVDIGGSGSRAALVQGTRRLLTVEAGPAALAPGGISIDPVLTSIAGTLADSSLPVPEVVSAGVAKLMGLGSATMLLAQVRRHWPAADVVLATDAVAALAGAFGTAGGAVVAVGTGAVGLGTDFRELWHRVDGWGHLLGDAGSGAWVGRAGLRAALRAHDRRPGGSPQLLAAARAGYGEPERWPRLLYPAGDPARLLAGFATAVAAAAHDGDEVAARIWCDAGQALAETAAAALVPGIPRRVAVVGGLTRAGVLLRDPFQARLRQLRPAITVASFGTSEPLDGAVVLAPSLLDPATGLTAHPPFTYLSRHPA